MTDYSRKLNETQVQSIRRFYWKAGSKQCDLASAFHISPSQVSQIIRRKSWVYLPRVANEPKLGEA